MMRAMIVLFTVVAALSGCAGGTVTTETLDAAGNVISRTIQPVADASVQKELAVHKTLQNRDNARKEMQKHVGFELDWMAAEEKTTIIVDGKEITMVTTRQLPKVSYRPEITFDNPLPTQPSEHPAYGMMKDVAKYTVYGVLGWKGIDALGDVLNTAILAAGPTLTAGGDMTLNQSLNDGSSDNAGPVITFPQTTAE